MTDENQLNSLRRLIEHQLSNPSSLNATKLSSNGLVDPSEVTLEQFINKCPFTTKAEIIRDHQKNPPFGSNLNIDINTYTRLSKTSGTSGESISWLDTSDDWSNMLDAWEFIYNTAALSPEHDIIYFAFSFGPFLGFWTAYEAAVRQGFLTVPGGGLSSDARLESIIDCSATVLCCTPTYAIRLGEANSKDFKTKIDTIIVAGEPGGSIPSVRARISKLWSNAKVIDHHGMTEVGPVSVQHSVDSYTLSLIPGFHLAEVIGLESGEEVDCGEEGELVLTTLKRNNNALLRYKTGDLVKKTKCNIKGNEVLGFDGGVLGRIDDMIVVRGVNIYPSAIDSVIREYDKITEYQVIIKEQRSMKELEIFVELDSSVEQATFIEILEEKLRSVFSLRIPVKIIKKGELKSFEFKAKRWITE